MSYRVRNIALAAGLAVIAGLLVTLYARSDNDRSDLGSKLVSVFVASQDIEAGTPGAEVKEMVRQERVAPGSVVPGAISNRNQVANLVAAQPIYAGEQVTARRFQAVAEQGLVGQITGNQRAVQMPGDANQLLAGTLKVGDRVDVLASVKFRVSDFQGAPATAGQTELTATRVVLRNLRVLRAPAAPEGSSGLGGTGGFQVMLAVTDNQAQKLFYVMKNAEWTLQLRPAHAAADSPGSVETAGSVLADGLSRQQFEQLVRGARAP